MEFMFFLLALIPIALLVLMGVLLGRLGAIQRELASTRSHMDELLRAMARWKEAPSAPPPTSVQGEAPVFTPEERPEPAATAPVEEVLPPLEVLQEPEPALEPEPVLVEMEAHSLHMEEVEENALAVEEVVERPVAPPPPPPVYKPTFFERHPDLEKFIGENLMNKIGIAVLVVGIGLLMKYAIGKGYISETGRTLIGLAAGAVLMFLGQRLHRGMRTFSSVLVAGGVAVLYFCIAIAYHEYEIIGQVPTFLGMVAITGLAVMLTLAWDRRELAVIALLGGFATPFMASSGEGNFKVLFTYLLILDVGMLVLANFKKWHIINILSFVLTQLIFGGWVLGPFAGMDPQPVLAALGFGTLFFLVFFVMNLRYNLRHKTSFEAVDHGLLLANTAGYYGAGLFLLADVVPRMSGLFTVLLGLFHLAFALRFHRSIQVPRSLQLLLIGLVLTFISLAAPVQLEGSHITLFWAAEAVLLLWFAHRTGLRLIERTSLLVALLMLVSLLMDLSAHYRFDPTTHLFLLNRGWITGVAAAVALWAMAHQLRLREPGYQILPDLYARHVRKLLRVLAVGLFFVIHYLELRAQLVRWMDPHAVNMLLMAYTLTYFLVLSFLSRGREAAVRVPVALLLALGAVLHITGHYANSRDAFLLVGPQLGAALYHGLHYLVLALVVLALLQLARHARALIERGSEPWKLYLWSMCAYIVVIASQELDHLMLLNVDATTAHVPGVLAERRRALYPVLWGVISFLFMYYGMKRRMRMVRVIALALFAFTLLKLFLVDLGALSEGGRVFAFILLGALLLVISFMYQRLKDLILKDGTEPHAPDDATQ
jgi:uncharacterized membrane protein